ncbi:MAG: thiamine pyrophosphate-dependent enzyme, partial [Deltaproteobacteria bacterium]
TSDDPKAYRKEADMIEERKKDPLPRMRAYLEREGLWDAAADKACGAEIDAMIKLAVDTAEKTDPPALETLFQDVYAEMPWHLREQLEEARRAPRGAGH